MYSLLREKIADTLAHKVLLVGLMATCYGFCMHEKRKKKRERGRGERKKSCLSHPKKKRGASPLPEPILSLFLLTQFLLSAARRFLKNKRRKGTTFVVASSAHDDDDQGRRWDLDREEEEEARRIDAGRIKLSRDHYCCSRLRNNNNSTIGFGLSEISGIGDFFALFDFWEGFMKVPWEHMGAEITRHDFP